MLYSKVTNVFEWKANSALMVKSIKDQVHSAIHLRTSVGLWTARYAELRHVLGPSASTH